jgi:argininosuccinate lyase
VIVETLAVNTERLGEDAGSHFTGAADLAEHLVVSHELDHRTAYQVVGNAVARAVADDRAGLTSDDVGAAWDELIGGAPPPGLDIDTLTDPVRIVAARDVLGGSAPRRVVEHAGRLRAQVGAAETWRTNAYLTVNTAEQSIVARARAAIAG